jgi:GAF domain-containing protein
MVNYNERMALLRYVAVLALVIWVGGLVALGAIAAPVAFDVTAARHLPDSRLVAGALFGEMLRRFTLVSYAAGGVLLLTLIARRILGPRPHRFGWRAALAALMLARAAASAPRVRSGARGPHQHACRGVRRGDAPRKIMTDMDRDGLATAISSAIAAAPGGKSAMEQAVRLLKDGVPHYTWVGIYVLEGDELVLGPYLGKPSPHTRIPLGRGICGAAATEKATIVVDDVNADARYLACSIETKSEIVVPIMRGDEVLGEIDIDSDQPAAFGARDRALLEPVAALLAERLAED